MECPRCGKHYIGSLPSVCSCGAVLDDISHDEWHSTVEMPPVSADDAPFLADSPTITAADVPGARGWPEPATPYAGWGATAPPPPPIARGKRRDRSLIAIGASLCGLALVLLCVAVALAQHGVPTTARASGGSGSNPSATSPTNKTPTITPSVTPTTLPAVGVGDPISGWNQSQGCVIQNGTLLVTNTTGSQGGIPCLSLDQPMSDSRIQVNATFVGNDTSAIGVAFRVSYDGPTLSDDEVYLTSKGQIFAYTRGEGLTSQWLKPRRVPMSTGPGATNTLTIVASGLQVTVLVNDVRVASLIDTYNVSSQGMAGLVVWQPGQQGAFRGWSDTALQNGFPLPGGA